ncbi:CbiX/SirB N-terminal domain-containing protein [Massilia sp. CFBP9026]|uniref:sirohydrochlorin chelatase n=1 Tax=Massilia sp. CFBP9026 TaxID=3096536 RepID=UPI002A6A7D1C|nr:CbiX/SirB N-terminal domain-containing protein [Massilia sp. CFBP9026]MDY0964397.1 CbiX/SirB N-terminal domain-containing protein [Massilia sp. CFBP9026]
MKHGLILFAHGARAASWAAPFERLRDATQARTPDAEVVLAFLELMTPSLPDTVAAMVARGIDQVTVVPVFLGQGGHLLRDLPALCDTIRAAHPGLDLNVVGAIGEDPGVQRAMTDYCVASLGARGD